MAQSPDEFRAYIEPHLEDDPVVTRMLDRAGAKVFIQTANLEYDVKDHFINVAHNIFRSITEAKYEWVRTNDDDDTWMCNTQSILENFASDNIVLIHGDKLHEGRIYKSRPILTRKDTRYSIGSGNIYNRDKFLKIRPYLGYDEMIDYGRFWDWRIAYWALRMNMKMIYVPIIFSEQFKDPNTPQWYLDKRKPWFDMWPSIMQRMDKIDII
jgi:hypothetical protein